MYKSILFIILLALNPVIAQASFLQDAARAAGVEASYEVDPDSIWAIEVIASHNGEATVSLLSHNFTEALKYDCHLHGTAMACHEFGHEHKSTKELSEIEEVETLALARLEKTLIRRGQSLADLDSYKVWMLSESEASDGHDHHEHEDFWIKASIGAQNYYQQCHIHESETEYSCHYKSEADVEGEPSF